MRKALALHTVGPGSAIAPYVFPWAQAGVSPKG